MAVQKSFKRVDDADVIAALIEIAKNQNDPVEIWLKQATPFLWNFTETSREKLQDLDKKIFVIENNLQIVNKLVSDNVEKIAVENLTQRLASAEKHLDDLLKTAMTKDIFHQELESLKKTVIQNSFEQKVGKRLILVLMIIVITLAVLCSFLLIKVLK